MGAYTDVSDQGGTDCNAEMRSIYEQNKPISLQRCEQFKAQEYRLMIFTLLGHVPLSRNEQDKEARKT